MKEIVECLAMWSESCIAFQGILTKTGVTPVHMLMLWMYQIVGPFEYSFVSRFSAVRPALRMQARGTQQMISNAMMMPKVASCARMVSDSLRTKPTSAM